MAERPVRARPFPLWCIGLLLLVFFSSLRIIIDYDIFYHIAIGREIFELGEIPEFEFYLYTYDGVPTHFYEWGFGLFFYISRHIGGLWGLSAANSLFVTLTALFLALAARERSGLTAGPMIALALVLIVMSSRFVYRPEMALFVAMAAAIYVGERALRRQSVGPFWAGMPICFLLVQMHPSVLFAGYTLAAYGVSVLHRMPADKRLRSALLLGAYGAGAIAASLINPYTWRAVLEPLLFVQETDMLRANAEFRSAVDAGLWPALIAILALAVFCFAKLTRRDWVYPLLILPFAYLTYEFARNLALLALASAPLFMAVFAKLIKAEKPRDRMLLRGVALVMATALFWLNISIGRWGAGQLAEKFPDEMVQVIRDMEFEGEIFNSYGHGGYLAWELYPDFRIFIDGRHYRNNPVLLAYSNVVFAEDGWQDILDSYNVDVIVAPTVSPIGEFFPIARELLRAPEWRFVMAEANVALYRRVTDGSGAEADDAEEQEQLSNTLRALAGPGRQDLYERLRNDLFSVVEDPSASGSGSE